MLSAHDTMTSRAGNPRTSDTAPAGRPDLDLDVLARMRISELGALYQRGRVPDTLYPLDGSPACRMLSSMGPLGRGAAAAAIRQIAGSSRFPWAGKSFSITRDDGGHGINRVRLPGGVREWFRFDLAIRPSAIDGEPCVVLDYEHPDNPRLIRHIHDELRQVAPGLFLGPAMWKTRRDRHLVLYFACQYDA